MASNSRLLPVSRIKQLTQETLRNRHLKLLYNPYDNNNIKQAAEQMVSIIQKAPKV
jgi:hypothetical protein